MWCHALQPTELQGDPNLSRLKLLGATVQDVELRDPHQTNRRRKHSERADKDVSSDLAWTNSMMLLLHGASELR